jgi:hypothetical protein
MSQVLALACSYFNPGFAVKVLAVFVSDIGSDSHYRTKPGNATEAITI